MLEDICKLIETLVGSSEERVGTATTLAAALALAAAREEEREEELARRFPRLYRIRVEPAIPAPAPAQHGAPAPGGPLLEDELEKAVREDLLEEGHGGPRRAGALPGLSGLLQNQDPRGFSHGDKPGQSAQADATPCGTAGVPQGLAHAQRR